MLDLIRLIRTAGTAAVVCLLALLVFSASAFAAGEYELNDTRETAYGPLSGGTDYTATFETDNDVDWYLFYVKTYSQLDFSASKVAAGPEGCSGVAHLVLRDKDGKELGEEGFYAGRLNEVNHLKLTLAAGRYYFEVHNHGCVGDRYRLRIDPASAITPSRVCGEAIVAKESVGPVLAKLVGELGKNTEALTKANGGVRAAQATLKRLKRRHASRSSKQAARRRLVTKQVALAKVLEQRVALQTLGAQYTTQISQAESQIASSC